MNPAGEIKVPREIVNDDFVTIASWQVAEGAAVQAGEVIVLVETSKAVLEVEAESEGYLHVLYPEGAEVGIGEVIGVLQPERAGESKGAVTSSSVGAGVVDGVSSVGGAGEARFSAKARVLIEAEGIDPAIFAGQTLVREAEVRVHMQARQESAAVAEVPVREVQVDGAEAPARPADEAPANHRRSLWQDARISGQERGRGMGWLLFHYVWHNWLLGNLVRWAPRMFILRLHKLRGVRIGKGCFIDPGAVMETAYPENITLGDDVRIASHVVIMTHIKPPHFLRETGIIPAVVKPVVLEDHCFIGVNAVIMPGVTVGQASVVASGAVVINNVPPFTMVMGNPAKVVKNFPRPEGQ